MSSSKSASSQYHTESLFPELTINQEQYGQQLAGQMNPVISCFRKIEASHSRELCYQEFLPGFFVLEFPMRQEVVVNLGGHGIHQ